MSALEDEGIKAILSRLATLESAVVDLQNHAIALAKGDVVWSYMDPGTGEGVHCKLAGQQFANEMTRVRTDIQVIADALNGKSFAKDWLPAVMSGRRRP